MRTAVRVAITLFVMLTFGFALSAAVEAWAEERITRAGFNLAYLIVAGGYLWREPAPLANREGGDR